MKGSQAVDCEVPTVPTVLSAAQYRPEALAECVCTPGTTCRSVVSKASIASVAGTILLRIALGTLLERFGPVNVQCSLLVFGAFWVAMSAAINSSWTYIFFRFCIGLVGAAFVTNQFWCPGIADVFCFPNWFIQQEWGIYWTYAQLCTIMPTHTHGQISDIYIYIHIYI